LRLANLFLKKLAMRFLKRILGALLMMFFAPTYAQDCVVVLMHGKWGGPQSPYLRVLAEKVRRVCAVELREMPWSRNRNYDETYEASLEKLSDAVREYRAKGYKTVFLGGQSFGANASIAYQAAYGDIDGVIALAPGHSPYEMYQMGMSRSLIEVAKKKIAEGSPEALIDFTDLNQGVRKNISIRADVLHSYFRPDGLGNMGLSASRFKKSVPFIWVIGTQDPLYRAGAAYAYEKAPLNPLSKYLVVDANHATTPEVASDQVFDWINRVKQ
jgi:pimeloyl-ACP methyl ester carboxylesterase